jgi:hypothetical protein
MNSDYLSPTQCPSCKKSYVIRYCHAESGSEADKAYIQFSFKNNTLLENYDKLLSFVIQCADESVYESFENLNELNWEAHEVLQAIGEDKQCI